MLNSSFSEEIRTWHDIVCCAIFGVNRICKSHRREHRLRCHTPCRLAVERFHEELWLTIRATHLESANRTKLVETPRDVEVVLREALLREDLVFALEPSSWLEAVPYQESN